MYNILYCPSYLVISVHFFTGLSKDNSTAELDTTDSGVDAVADNSKINIHWITSTYSKTSASGPSKIG